MKEKYIWWSLFFIGLCLMLGAPTLKKNVPIRFLIGNGLRPFLWLMLGYTALLLSAFHLFRKFIFFLTFSTALFLLLLLVL